MINKRILTLLSVITLFFLIDANRLSFAHERKITRLERKADSNFIRQKFDKATLQYEEALEKEKDLQSKSLLDLKIARLYFIVKQYKVATVHYGRVFETNSELFNLDDVCNYIDALRFIGDVDKVEATCFNEKYKDIYGSYQRYQNSLDALATKKGMLCVESDYSIKKLSVNTKEAEFWIGNFNGQTFYAKSYSPFNDPQKIFFHRTHYYLLDDKKVLQDSLQSPHKYYDYFRKIPADMQNGTVTFSPDMKLMVAAVIENNKDRISVGMADDNHRPLRSKLFYSKISDKKHRFSKYSLLFPQDKNSSYSHPYFFNDGKSLLFTSDMPGGYGGFDLYVIHWDDNLKQWGKPINLGPEVNTEGDEISPIIFQDKLIFSSNGLPGFGGYDLFCIDYDIDHILSGSLKHFPYPINSEFNDYYMYPTSTNGAYVVSDRNLESNDDIYYLTKDSLSIQDQKLFFGSIGQSKNLNESFLHHDDNEKVLSNEDAQLNQSAPEELLLTLYFDFDSSKLTEESLQLLHKIIDKIQMNQFSKLKINGFADEMGRDHYNYLLSEKRALGVLNFLRDNGVTIDIATQAYGKVSLSTQEKEKEIKSYNWPDGKINWIKVNRKARRVDIYNKN